MKRGRRIGRRLGLAVVGLVSVVTAGTIGMAGSASAQFRPAGGGSLTGNDWTLVGNAAIVTDGAQTPATVLRLSPASTYKKGWSVYGPTIPTTSGVDVSFSFAQWSPSGTSNAGYDGISFWVQDARDTHHSAIADFGPDGYDLGYAPRPSVNGLSGALLGVGFAAGFDDALADGTGCSTPSGWRVGNTSGNPDRQNTISVRGGPGLGGNRQGPYCLVAPSVVTSSSAFFNNLFTSRATATRYVRITIDPSTVSPAKVTVYYGSSATLTASDIVIQADAPANLLSVTDLRIGFAGSTGAWVNNNEIWGFESAAETYELTFEPQGGSVSPTSDSYTKTASSGPMTLPSPPTRSGYVFTGWYSDPTGGTQLAGPTDTTFMPTGSATLYAQWVAIAAPTFTDSTLAPATTGESYSDAVAATGPDAGGAVTYSWTGTTPPGLGLDPTTGAISGIPTQAGSFAFTVTATNTGGSTAQPVTLTVSEPAVTTTTAATPDTTGDTTVPARRGGLPYTGKDTTIPFVLLALVLLSWGGYFALSEWGRRPVPAMLHALRSAGRSQDRAPVVSTPILRPEPVVIEPVIVEPVVAEAVIAEPVIAEPVITESAAPVAAPVAPVAPVSCEDRMALERRLTQLEGRTDAHSVAWARSLRERLDAIDG